MTILCLHGSLHHHLLFGLSNNKKHNSVCGFMQDVGLSILFLM